METPKTLSDGSKTLHKYPNTSSRAKEEKKRQQTYSTAASSCLIATTRRRTTSAIYPSLTLPPNSRPAGQPASQPANQTGHFAMHQRRKSHMYRQLDFVLCAAALCDSLHAPSDVHVGHLHGTPSWNAFVDCTAGLPSLSTQGQYKTY